MELRGLMHRLSMGKKGVSIFPGVELSTLLFLIKLDISARLLPENKQVHSPGLFHTVYYLYLQLFYNKKRQHGYGSLANVKVCRP